MFVELGPVCTDITILPDQIQEGDEEFLVSMDENPLELPATRVIITDVCK